MKFKLFLSSTTHPAVENREGVGWKRNHEKQQIIWLRLLLRQLPDRNDGLGLISAMKVLS
jgi:hypothetical protein